MFLLLNLVKAWVGSIQDNFFVGKLLCFVFSPKKSLRIFYLSCGVLKLFQDVSKYEFFRMNILPGLPLSLELWGFKFPLG